MQATPQIGQSSFPGPINGPVSLTPSVSHAVICLHGFGSNGDDLISLAPAFHATLGNLGESLAVYSPNGISPTPTGQGFQWFRDAGWTFRDESGLQGIATQLDSFINAIATHHTIPAANIALLGFSQGAMAILHALPSLTHRPAGLISCAGTLSVTPSFPPNPLPEPILFLHGIDDDVLPADTSIRAADTFKSHNYPVQVELIPDLGHGINNACLAHIAVFLQSLWPA